jgi:chaperonin cofactor prefoldin
MEARFRKATSGRRWVVFVSVAVCIAAVGVSSYFYELRRAEREKRVFAENRLSDLRSEIRLLEDKNRELAEQLREARRVAEELAGEREALLMARAEAFSQVEAGPSPPVPELAEPAAPEDTEPAVPGEAEPAAPEETEPAAPEELERLRDVVSRLRLERIAVAAEGVGTSAGEAWRTLREALASSAKVARAAGGANPPEEAGPTLADVMKAFPSAQFVRVAAMAQDSVRKTFGPLGGVFSSVGKATTASAPPPVVEPPASPTKLTATNEELQKELAEVRQEKRELEREIAERTGKIPGSVDVGKVRITTGRRFAGKVLVVKQKYNFVVIDIGRNQGMEKGEVLIVHRGSRFIGKVEVIKVYEKMAAADLVMNWMQDDVQVNDGVKKF